MIGAHFGRVTSRGKVSNCRHIADLPNSALPCRRYAARCADASSTQEQNAPVVMLTKVQCACYPGTQGLATRLPVSPPCISSSLLSFQHKNKPNRPLKLYLTISVQNPSPGHAVHMLGLMQDTDLRYCTCPILSSPNSVSQQIYRLEACPC